MNFDPETRALIFASPSEVEEFHRELTDLLREAMMHGTRHIEEAAQAKGVSQQLMRENRALMSALNLLRRYVPRKQF